MTRAARTGRSTSLRLSLQFALLYALLSALVFAGAYALTRYETRDWVEDRMRSDARDLTRLAEEEGPGALVAAVAALSRVNYEAERVYHLAGADGERAAGNVDGLPPNMPRYLAAEGLTLPSGADDEVSGYWTRQDRIGDLVLVQGTSDHVVFEILEALVITLGLGFIVILAVGTAAGVRVGRLTGDRVGAISDALAAAAAGDLAARVPERVARSGDDLGRVAADVNAALAEIADLMEAQEAVTAQVAHDLRTPMQRLRQRIECLEGSDPDARDAALIEIEGILRTFRALLSIAEIGTRMAPSSAEPLNFGQLVREIAETYEPVAEDANLALALDLPETGPSLRGDRDLLVQLVANLVENAITHATGATRLALSARGEGGMVVLIARDDGPGIPVDQAEAVFRRFHRLDAARTTGGSGLGLSLVRAIARLHGGEARIVPEAGGGATVEVRLGRG